MPATSIGKLIDHDPRIRTGRPKIAGTGITVQRIVTWYKGGATPEEIAENFGYVSLAQVHAALAYYHANQEEMEAAMAADEAAGDRAEKEHYHARQAR